MYIRLIGKYIWYTGDSSSMEAATITVIITSVIIIKVICFFTQN